MDSFSEYLDKLVNRSLPSQQEKSLKENISLLKKKLCTKDELIKKLIKNQSTLFNTISTKYNNNQHSNTLNQYSFPLLSISLIENSQKTKQLASQEQ